LKDTTPAKEIFTRSHPLIKFCGLTVPEDGKFAALLGADMAGFIFSPESKRYLPPEKASEMETFDLKRAGVFVREKPSQILEIASRARLDYVQLHGPYEPEDAKVIGPERVIRVVWPESFSDSGLLCDHLKLWDDLCAFFLFDAGASFGGHGRTLRTKDLSFLGLFPHKSLLAGGLGPSNIDLFWPALKGELLGFDFNSAVEISPGVKNHEAMRMVAGRLKGEGEAMK
jgi:phosphoribosylanthranilate isomerase